MIPYTKTLDPTDYTAIAHEVKLLENAASSLAKNGVRVDIGHGHRFWEYGMATKVLFDWMGKRKSDSEPSIVDIGAGVSLFGPSLHLLYDMKVMEIEPETYPYESRCLLNAYLHRLSKRGLDWVNASLHDVTGGFDAVFCISVIEHMDDELACWSKLADLVAPGGLLFMTTDIVPDRSKRYTYDNLRHTNYDIAMFIEREQLLERKGLKLFGGLDSTFNGCHVHDYSFASLAMVRE